jgi:hypothetical protein
MPWMPLGFIVVEMTSGIDAPTAKLLADASAA